MAGNGPFANASPPPNPHTHNTFTPLTHDPDLDQLCPPPPLKRQKTNMIYSTSTPSSMTTARPTTPTSLNAASSPAQTTWTPTKRSPCIKSGRPSPSSAESLTTETCTFPSTDTTPVSLSAPRCTSFLSGILGKVFAAFAISSWAGTARGNTVAKARVTEATCATHTSADLPITKSGSCPR